MRRSTPDFNGTIADEREVLDVCLGRLYVGAGQVVRSLTLSGLRGDVDEARMLAYLRENLAGLCEETLADFVAKNRERHPVEPDFDPEGQLTCLDDGKFHDVFRDGGGGSASVGCSRARTARSGSRGSGSTGA